MRRVALVLLLLVAGCSHFSIGPASESFEPAHYAPGELSMQGALAVARVAGTPDEIGAQLGALAGRPAAELLSSFEFAEHFRSLVAPECAPLDELVRSVPESHRRELEALAHIAGVDSGALLRANAVVDACACTAFVASGAAVHGAPLLVGRNLDFAPANVLGPKTLVTLYRPQGQHAFVSIGWPGFAAVASGMNDQGLVAAILVNSAAKPRGEGVPLGFLVRRLLEECSTVAEARALFAASPPASGHYVLLADAKDALVVSRDAPERSLRGGLLACTNGQVDAGALVQLDARSRRAWSLLRESQGAIDVEAMRQFLAATYLRLENTQSMVFEPASRTLWLARGTTFEPAALARWDRLDLRDAFAGGEVRSERLEPVRPRFEHWKDGSW